jgi:poly(beta-D-mannuronate) lyase
MKQLILFVLLSASVSLVSGQALTIHQKGSSAPQTFQLTDIDSITFELSSSPSQPTEPSGEIQYPADILDLTMWELTLPLAEDDPTMGSTPKDVYMKITEPGYESQKDFLDTYSHPVHFHVNDASDGVVFRCHAGGATTPNSSYSRTELREMEPGYTTQNDEKASWSTSSGTHTMYIKQAITEMTLTAKPDVVIGQIHGGDDDLTVFIYSRGKIWIREGNSKTEVIDDSYQIGTVMEVKMVASGGKVKYYYNNMSTPVHEISANDSGCYFKAGCYVNSNPDKGEDADAYATVEIYDLKVTHTN